VNTQNAKTLSTNESFLKTYKLNSMPSTYFEHFVVNFDDPKNLPKTPNQALPTRTHCLATFESDKLSPTALTSRHF